MIIDVHVHLPYNRIFPEAFIDNVSAKLTGNDPKKQALIRKLIKANLNDSDGKGLLSHMAAAGIDKSVLLIADFGVAMGEPELSVAEMHQLHHMVLRQHPDKFIVFGGVDPRRGRDGYDVFETAVKHYGFKGLKLYPPCGFELDDPRLYPLYELCSHYKIPVLSHTGPSFSSLRTERQYPDTALKVSSEFPDVDFILGHGGAVAWRSNISVARQRKNVYLEISTFQNTVRTPEELEERFRLFFEYIPEQILFGSDWPMFMMGSSLKSITQIVHELKSITDEQKQQLFYLNAKRLLKL